MRPFRLALLQLVVLALCSSQPLGGAQRNGASETPEDCDLNRQYFDRVGSKCRNCSDALRVFELTAIAPEWQSFSASDNRNGATATQTANNNKPPAPDSAQNFRSRTDLMSSVIGSRLTPLPPTAANNRQQTGRRPGGGGPLGEPPRSAADAILSRLVLASQPSPDQTLGAPVSGAANEDDDLDQSNSLTSLGVNPIANSQQEQQLDESEHADLQVQEQTNLVRLARLWQKLLWDFLQSNEISESSLLDSIEQCRSIQNLTACQMWANMCVMTMYSHSESSSPSSFNAQIQRQASSSTLRRPTTMSSSTPRRAENRLGETSDLKTSWQQCAKFNLATVCNSLRDWRRLEKQQSPLELGDIFGNEDVEASLPSRLGALQSSPLRLGQQIQVVAYEYAFDGRLLNVHQFDLGDLSKFCLFSPFGSLASARAATTQDENNETPHARPANHARDIRVGANVNLRCQFSAPQASLFAPRHLNQTKFVDLFVGYQLNGAAFVKPVPILLRNLLYQGQLVNLKHAKDPTRWKFVHRYFPFATVKLGQNAGRKAAAAAAASDFQPQEDGNNGAANQDREVLLFVRSANFEIKLRRQQDKGLVISSMLLILDYDHLQLVRGRRSSGPAQAAGANSSGDDDAADDKLYESHIQVSQISVEMQAYAKDLDLFVTIICITSSIWTLIKCYNIQRYQGLIKLDIHSLCLFLVIACDIIANLLGVITIAFALFLFVALKLQIIGDQQRLLAPDVGLEQNLLLKLTLAFSMKLIGFLYKLAIRLGADLFFIDWERPKMLTSTQMVSQQQQSATTSNGSQASKQLPTEGKPHPVVNSILQRQPHQVSFWRPYTIINRWLQMQTMRRLNLTLQLATFVSLMELFKLDRLATSDPSLTWPPDDDEPTLNEALEFRLKPNTSPTFRALILSLVYVALAAAQIVYKKYFHEPMIKCPIREFVDLCSVGNVSLFSMLYPRYGFYVHGRNANGSGDCGLVEMNVLLEREERDLCSRRGLQPESDQQTFVLVLPKIVNDHYRKLLFRIDHSQLRAASSTPLTLNGNRSPLKRQQQQQPAEFIRSALSLPSSLSTSANQSRSRSFSSMRALIESVVARNRAINVFLINFLEHAYKDIDYSIRKRRRFESLLMEIDLSDEQETASIQQASKFSRNARGAGGAPSAMGGANSDMGGIGRAGGGLLGAGSQNFDGSNQLAAAFFVDADNSFASLIWLGLEWDLIAIELFMLLNIDLFLGSKCLILTVSLIWLINKLLKSVYSTLARRNLVTKSMLDEKFLIRA